MTIELQSFSLQEVFCNWKLLVLSCMLLLMLLSLLGAFVYGNIVGFRVMKMVLRHEIDLTSVFSDNQYCLSCIFKVDSIRQPLFKGIVCLLIAFAIGIIVTLCYVIFLVK